MPFTIQFNELALECVKDFRKSDQKRILEAIQERLTHQPSLENRNRKQLRPNQLAQWELRIGDFRVFYNVTEEESRVEIVAVGCKDGNKVIIRGKEWQL